MRTLCLGHGLLAVKERILPKFPALCRLVLFWTDPDTATAKTFSLPVLISVVGYLTLTFIPTSQDRPMASELQAHRGIYAHVVRADKQNFL